MRSGTIAALSLTGLLISLGGPRESGDGAPRLAGGVALVGVTVIDMLSGGKATNQTVVIDGSRIVALGPSASTSVPSGSRRVEAKGKFLIPGLWDTHVHLSMTGRSALALFLANGVTAVRDMGGDPKIVLPWRDSIAAGQLAGPRIKAAGIIVESARWLNSILQRSGSLNQPSLTAELRRRFGVGTAEDAQRAVDSLSALRADFIKIRNYPSLDAYSALARAARGRGLRIAGHAAPIDRLGEVSDSGFASIEHAVIAVQADTLLDAFDAMTDSDRTAFFRRLATNGTAFSPTFVSTRARFVPDSAVLRMAADTTGRTDSVLRYVSPKIRDEWRMLVAIRAIDSKQDWRQIYRSTFRDVRQMRNAGVRILTGTDVPVATLIPGFSLIDEIELLVKQANLTPLEALQSATVNPPFAVGLEREIGSIAEGQLADLVLLDRDPLSDVANLRSVWGVVANGRLFERRDLDRLLSAAADW